MQKNIALVCIVSAGLITAIAVGMISGTLKLTKFSQYRDDARFYNEKALTLIKTGSLHDETSEFRKPPVYSAFLAGVYWLLGERPHSAWLVQALIFVATVIILFTLSESFFVGVWAYVMPLLFVLSWWEVFYVFKIGSDLLAIFLLACASLLTIKRISRFSYGEAMAWGVLFSLLILTKPIVLYAMPLLLIIAFWRQWKKMAVALMVVLVLVGGWMVRNFILLHEYQIEQTGHIVWQRGVLAESSSRDIVSWGVAALAGDYVADKFFPGYAMHPLPSVINGEAKRIWDEKQKAGKNDFQIDREFLDEGIAKLKKHPVRSLVVSIPAFIELNAPSNHRGFPMTHFLVGTREHMSDGMKLALIIFVRGMWLLFLGVVLYGMCDKKIFSDRRWLFLFMLVVYFDAMHALVIIPMETRYLAPIVPIYFLFFARGLKKMISSHV